MIKGKSKTPIPYRICDHIYIEQVDNHVIYINLSNVTNFVLPYDAHERILTGNLEGGDGLGQYLYLTIEMLIAQNYIEPDLEKIQLGKTFIYIPGSKWRPDKRIDKNDLKDILTREYLTPIFNLENAGEKYDFNKYEFLCARNSLRVTMQTYGIKSPLLWMNAGLFIYDDDFKTTGKINTSFARSMVDTGSIPILGEKKVGLDWNIIDAHLEKQLPVLVDVDVYHMPYKDNPHYHNRHGAHSIILVEKRDKDYLVLDWYHPGYFYGEITTEELEAARTSENEKQNSDIFSGYPILAYYQLIYLDRFPLNLEIARYIKSNLLKSVKCMIEPTGVLSLFNNSLSNIPGWLKMPNAQEYTNAIESFFLFDLELKFLIIYYEEMFKFNFCSHLKPNLLQNKTKEIRSSIDKLRYKLILAKRKNKAIEPEIWVDLLTQINISLGEYCEVILKNRN
ncbi:MAG: BtrH N-terminal domain-containing protein [Lachnospiraceae bacterium]|nr:BtrH N-terminal domain-containing protein [Lachnospiraceae bacterium]